MNKTMFENTKWDVREWSDEMKKNWNREVQRQGFDWLCSEQSLLNSTHLWVNKNGTVSYIDDGDIDFFLKDASKEMKYKDMFPSLQGTSITTMDDDIFSQMKTIAKENSMFISFDGLNDGEEDVIVVTHVSSDTEYIVNDIEEFSLLTQSFKALEKFERKI